MAEFDLQSLKNIKLDAIRDYFFSLSERERLIVAITVAALVLIMVGSIISSASGKLRGFEDRIANEERYMKQIDKLKKKYLNAKSEVDSLENIVKRTPASFSLGSHLEKLSQQFGIELDSMNPKSTPPNELYAESQVEVRIKKVPLKKVVDYFYRIEKSRQMIRISSLNIKPSYSAPGYLTVTFTASVFKTKE